MASTTVDDGGRMSRQLTISTSSTPEFRIFSQTIHMTDYTSAEFDSDPGVQLIYYHEYGHLLQAVTTRFGIANFRMVARRYTDLFSAIYFQPDLAAPYRNWPPGVESNPRVAEFLRSEVEFGEVYTLGMGAWSLLDQSTVSDFRVAELPVQVGSRTTTRLHVSRTLQGSTVWIPLLPKALCEAHSETLGEILSGQPSTYWSKLGSEPDRETLFYTSILGLAYSRLPAASRRGEVVLMLADHALMFQRPDQAFVAAVDWLVHNSVNVTDVRRVRRDLFGVSNEALSLQSATSAIDEASEIYALATNDVTEMVRYRLNLSRKAVEARLADPAVFLPSGTIASERVRLHSAVPCPRVEFRDQLHAIGEVPAEMQDHQSMLSSAAHLLKVVAADPADRSGTDLDPTCPFKSGPCTHPKEVSCALYPWERGEVTGEDEFCHYGRVGGLLWFHFARDPPRLAALVRSTAGRLWLERGGTNGEDWRDWFEARRKLGIPDYIHL
jgi:hypothetical protein